MMGEEKPKKIQITDSPFSTGMVLVVDKPYGWTSFDVVNKFRYLLSRRLGVKRIKVGHAGTLDPLATGAVILCTGKATKQIESLQSERKCYTTTIRLGETTPSFDLETEVDATYSTEGITRERLLAVLNTFVGEIEQEPPLFSACKVNGKRAYELARQGADHKLDPKPITIYGIELLSYNLPDITLRIECGKGTYIRALARDIGKALDCGGHLTDLRRLSVGAYRVDEALEPSQFAPFIDEKVNAHLACQEI